jgi:desampylase
VLIATDLHARLLAEAAAAPDREVCGLLFGSTDRIEAAAPCRNVASDPARLFELDPAALLAAHRAMRAGGPRLVGHYHSHPSGRAVPSVCDAADAQPDGALWLILGGGEARLWRAVAAGAVHGRFDPVPLTCTGRIEPPHQGPGS